jgi:predicted ATPase/DNA-binding winged helix-turn-helix (wHTH) protein
LSESLRFGRAEVRPRERQLLVEGITTGVGARAFDLLLALIERRDRLVTKTELLDLVWPGLVVEENNLQVQISSLRKLLGPQSIATVPGRGYQFTATLDGVPVTDSGANRRGSIPSAAETRMPAVRRTNLPSELPVLYGREEDLQALRSLMTGHRLVTVVGAGGIGKSRLAQAAAHASLGQWPDGAWMVELAGLSEPALLPSTVAGALDVKVADQGTALNELVAGIAPRTMLLVLDNCEHLLDAVVPLVEAIRQAAPDVTLLATSQEPLRVPDEQQFRLMPLAVPAQTQASNARAFGAVALFEARVRAVDPRFALNDENAKLAIDICRRLDGLPLAIELAAARVPTLGLRAVRDKLDARFKLLTGGSRATLRRHQTLRAALEWSHGLLNEAERIVFRRLGVFAGGFTMELAQAVAASEHLDEWAVLEHLSGLVDKSLVVAETVEPPRYRLLESARAFALEQLAEGHSGEGETADTLKRHAMGMLNFLRQVDEVNIEGELRTDQYAALVVPELDNLRAAHAWATAEDGDPKVAMALAAHAGSLIDYAAECADWLLPHRQQVEAGVVDKAVAARYWRALAAGNMSGRVPLALCVDAAERARALYQSLGKARRVFGSLIRLALYQQLQGNQAAVKAALAEARSLIRPEWPAEFHIHLLRRERSLVLGPDALAILREEVRLSTATGDWRLELIARNNFVDTLWQVGPIEEAAREARQLREELRMRPSTATDMDVMFANLIGILCEMDLIAEASDAAREALPVMRRSRNYYLEEWVYLFWRRGQSDVAARLLGAFDASFREIGMPSQSNEQRLIDKARAALEKELPPEALAKHLAAGASLDPATLPELLSESLAQRAQPSPDMRHA